MCGIVGVISKSKVGIFNNQLDIFKQMFFANMLRGTDGAGMFYNDEKSVTIVKGPVTSLEMMQWKSFKAAMTDAIKEGQFVIGHNRAATRGNLTFKNTHPFNEDHITLVHNGTLISHKNLDEKVEVDSHAICTHMAKNGYYETIKNIDGAFALVWYNDKEKKLYLTRNTQRPLYLVETDNFWVVSSELKLAEWILDRNNTKVKSSLLLESKKVYEFDIEDCSTYKTYDVEHFVWKYQASSYPVPVNATEPSWVKEARDQQETKKWGDKIVFSPDRFRADDSAIIWDDKRHSHFLLGKIKNSPFSTVKVYGGIRELKELEDWDELEGIVKQTVIRGQMRHYFVESVVPISEREENEEKKDVTCGWCKVPLLPEDVKSGAKVEGEILCPTCTADWDNFKDYGDNYVGGMC